MVFLHSSSHLDTVPRALVLLEGVGSGGGGVGGGVGVSGVGWGCRGEGGRDATENRILELVGAISNLYFQMRIW